ncbi:MAG: hypothetical protein C0P72_006705 [Clostridia bacterium]
MKVKAGEWLSIPPTRRWLILIYVSALQKHKREWAKRMKAQKRKRAVE